ncbi:hypothetical protein BU17DRAFT_49890 [Hysterangium stoloniferum]|nr:hypothetical protein BU17DRAFT_49890 [Hysterangium stoloniferum]
MLNVSLQAQELDEKIQDIYKRIQRERKVIEASEMMRLATSNQEVIRKADTQSRTARRHLSYFESTLRELQSRKLQSQGDGGSYDGPPGYMASPGGQPPNTRQQRWTGADSDSQSPNGEWDARNLTTSPVYEIPKAKNYTNLDLVKADTPLTTAKISRMLHQLEFKLQVEKQYKNGIDKMAKLYQADHDKKSRQDVEMKKMESKRIESEAKIQLLQTALKQYKGLHILDDVEEEEGNRDCLVEIGGDRKDNLRKPLSGKLQISVRGARELDHAPFLRSGRSFKPINDTTVVIKVEGTQRAKSHPSRTDKWMEDFEMSVDKANEIEVTVYDKQVGTEIPVPIGLLWININDIVEALRRAKVQEEGKGGGWVTAGAMREGSYSGPPGPEPGFVPHSGMGGVASFGANMQGGNIGPMSAQQQSEGIEAWFSVEPAGAIALNLNFVKENVRKRPLDAGGLGRQGAVRKRKGEVHEMNGHKFVQKQFYQIILCAFCNEFLLNALGYQCEDCRYTCHKKCYEKVVTKCISKSTNELDRDEVKINHRIPHRFGTITNIGANWCCHCGYMLPLGRKNARKCSECDLTCHASCAHLVPDFCGMSMETANTLLAQWRTIDSNRRAQRPPQPQIQVVDARMDQVTSQLDQARISPSDRRQEPKPELPPLPPAYQIPAPPQAPPPGQYPDRFPQPSQQMHPYQPPPLGQVPVQRPPGTRTSLPQGPAQPSTLYPQDAQPVIPQPAPYPTQKVPAAPQIQTPQTYPQRQSTVPSPVSGSQGLPPSTPVQVQRTVTRRRKVGLDDFNFLAVLGKGNFGKVMLAEEKQTNGLYAIKVLKKEFIIDNDEVESTRSEKRVFLAAAKERHPFLLGLHSCFQTETRVYFVMEYVSGGDLMLHIQRKQFSLRQAKFYASEVLLALEYFHSQGIIYRDLKLDNILLTLDGHVKVADYGLCKEDMWFGNTTSTFCGTPEFMAPEILLEQRYGRAVDWWAFGVLTYEMLLGQSPFRGDDEDEIFDAILEDEPLYPITMPRDAVSILQKLLTREPTRRLGSGKADAEEIKRHPFFKDVNFDDVFHKRIPPPYFPTINGSADTSNFDEEFTREQPTLTPVHGQLSARDQNEFQGFSWVASWADV